MRSPTRRELARVAAHALEVGWGTRAESIACLRDYWNAVFRVRVGDRSLLLRLHSPRYHDAAEIASELEWLLALSRDTRLGVARPIRDRRRRLAPVIDLPRLGPRACTLLTWVDGRRLSRFGVPTYERLGALTAALHAHAAKWRRPRGFRRRRRWDAESLGRYPFGGDADAGWRGLAPARRRLFRRVLDRLAEIERDLRRTHPSMFGLLHADLHRGNVVSTPRGLVPIDFDDAGFGCHLYDLAATLAQERFGASSPHAAALLAGYRAVRSLDAAAAAHLDAFVAARAVTVVIIVRGWAIEDPRFAPRVERVERALEPLVRACAPR